MSVGSGYEDRASENEDRAKAFWSVYDACTDCGARAKNPCREGARNGDSTKKRMIPSPHRNRPKLPIVPYRPGQTLKK